MILCASVFRKQRKTLKNNRIKKRELENECIIQFSFLVTLSSPLWGSQRGSGVLLLLENLVDEAVCLAPFVHEIEHVADVNADATSEFPVEEDVT